MSNEGYQLIAIIIIHGGYGFHWMVCIQTYIQPY